MGDLCGGQVDDLAGDRVRDWARDQTGEQRLCLLTVHAHPDDEASKGPATVAKYHHEGVRTVLVCCTGGEEGDILNPEMDRPEVRESISEVRSRELRESARVIGYDEVVMLGYRDSGMAGSEANKHPECFAMAPLGQAVARLVAVIRRERPQVMISYPEDQSGYPHPDHIKAHEVAVAAFEAAGQPDSLHGYGDLGEPWQPLKLYYVIWSGKRIQSLHHKFLELGLESPFDEGWLKRAASMDGNDVVTTEIDISEFADVRREALLAHATQVDPKSRFWFGLPPEVARTVHLVDEYVLARSLVSSSVGEARAPKRDDNGARQLIETDLFEGIRSARDPQLSLLALRRSE